MVDSSFTPKITEDGSFTFFSERFGEAFHSDHGARQEAEVKYVQPALLAQKAQRSSLTILDVCYGLGYNTAAALQTIWAANPTCRVEWIGLELELAVSKAAIAHGLLKSWAVPIPSLLKTLAETGHVEGDRLYATLLAGDARQTIQQVRRQGFRADAIFLDPFSPPHCPELWTVEFVYQLAQCLKPDGRLVTYSCAASVRTALIANKLHVGSVYGTGRRSPGTIASFSPNEVPSLTQQEQEHLHTRAAIPYRDPTLADLAVAIVHRHRQEQATSLAEPTSQWKKRWRKPLGVLTLQEYQ